MKITQRQKNLIDNLSLDQSKADSIYRPGPYWSYKCKKASH